MEKIVLKNGVRLLYKFKDIEHTSFCISLESGANAESKEEIGMAHALEHMLFKGNCNLKEDYINKKLDDLFGFNNAMTNFPYVIYYGTTAKEDFEEGFSLYSDIVLNSDIQEEGLLEELSVIKRECDEWKEDLEQYVEDLALENALPGERIGNLIIGEKHNIDSISFKGLKDFYNRNYLSENMVISVVSSLSIERVKDIVEKNFNRAKSGKISRNSLVRDFKGGIFSKNIEGNKGSKICCLFDISSLSMEEISLLKVFNLWFGEGVSSILYDEIRTKKGLAYEVYSQVKYEKGIGLFKIYVGTSKEGEEEVLGLIENCILKAINIDEFLKEEDLTSLIKRFRLKTSLELEKSIVLANRIAIYETMFNKGEYIFKELNLVENIKLGDIKSLVRKVFKKSMVQIIN